MGLTEDLYNKAERMYESWMRLFSGKVPEEYKKELREFFYKPTLRPCYQALEFAESDEEKAKVYDLIARFKHIYWDKKMPTVLEEINKAIKLAGSDKEKAKFLNNRAQFLYEWGDYRGALESVECAIKLDLQNPRLRTNRELALRGLEGYHWPIVKEARELKEKGELNRARTKYESALRLAREVNNNSFADLIQKELDELNSLDKQ